MTIALAIFLFYFSVILHEAAHAIALCANGIKISEFGIGLPHEWMPSLSFVVKGIKFRFNIIVIVFYVKHNEDEKDERKMKELSFTERSIIYGSGILANFLFAMALFIAIILFVPSSKPFFEKAVNPIATLFGIIPVSLATMLAFCFFLVIGYKIFCKYVVLLAGLAMVVLLVILAFHSPAQTASGMIGPVGMMILITKVAIDIPRALAISGFLSLCVGLTNMLPFFPLDGGKIMEDVLKFSGKKMQKIYRYSSASVFGLLVSCAVFMDFARIFR